jgi:hypothetical protein
MLVLKEEILSLFINRFCTNKFLNPFNKNWVFYIGCVKQKISSLRVIVEEEEYNISQKK